MMQKKMNYCILLSILVLFTNCGHKEAEPTPQTTYVKVETVGDQLDGKKLVYNAKVKEKSLTKLSFRVAGPLVKLKVNTGDYVQKGQLLAAIDKRDYELQVKTSQARWKQLQHEYARYKELFEKDKIPANSFEKIESGYNMAKAAYDNAMNQLNDTELRAPLSGYINDKFAQNYQTVGAGQPIVSILDLSTLEIVVPVPESQILQVKDTPYAYLTVKSAQAQQLEITKVSVSENTKKDGMFEVKYHWKNDNSYDISPGMTAEITLHCPLSNTGTTIPSSSVFNQGNQAYVWVYNKKNGQVNKRPVTLKSLVSNGRVEISEGIHTGETIVAAGVNYLSEGQLVIPLQHVSKTNIGGLL